MGAVSTFKGTSVTGAYWAVLALMDMKLCDTAAVMKLIEEIKTAKGKKEDEKHRYEGRGEEQRGAKLQTE